MSHSIDLVDRYAVGGNLLKYAAADIAPDHARARPGPGAWSLAELAVHLLDSDLVASDRMKRVIAEENPTLYAYDENAWTERLQANDLPIDEAASLFAANRAWTARILKNCSEADFGRSGMHTEAGRQTLAELVTKYVSHLDHHLKFLYMKRANLGIAVPPRYART